MREEKLWQTNSALTGVGTAPSSFPTESHPTTTRSTKTSRKPTLSYAPFAIESHGQDQPLDGL